VSAAAAGREPRGARPVTDGGALGPWLWGAPTDLAAFGGSALLALALVALAPQLAPSGVVPAWATLALVVGVDVAHVWTTLARTYLDPDERAAHAGLYLAVPLGCFVVGALLTRVGLLAFWRVLAYLALVHFVRQQIGWVAIYRARAGLRSPLDRALDELAVYASTLYPVLVWHAHAPRAFDWFVEGDFVAVPSLLPALPGLRGVWLLALGAYAVRAVALGVREGRWLVGKHLVVATTALTWFWGIVGTDADFPFTVANVLPHGVPYAVLLWRYARARSDELARASGPTRPRGVLVRLVRAGPLVAVAAVVGLALAEELLWETLIHRDTSSPLSFVTVPELPEFVVALLVPLLALPQATHYVLDAVLWRRGATGSAQAVALGFRGASGGALGN
jgi:hypothetical protein